MADFPKQLLGYVWHATKPQRWQQIRESEAILPEPPIPDSDRWGTGFGPSHYPFVRSLGGVSLFDFRSFDEARQQEAEATNAKWRAFVPSSPASEYTVWLQLNFDFIRPNFLSPEELVSQWRTRREFRRKIMAVMEAAHIGPIPISAINTVLVFQAGRFVPLASTA